MRQAKGKRISILIFLLGAVFLFSTGMALHTLVVQGKEKAAFDDLSAIVAEAAERDTASTPEEVRILPDASAPAQINTAQPNPADETHPEQSADPVPLPQYAPLYERNADFFGWLSIEGTDIDYPVMYSPDRPEYYLNRAFDGSYSGSGVPFVDAKCPADGNYYLIYGHHMQNKTMFGSLPKYADKSYYEGHPTIRFDTLYEQREYQVIAAFYSRIYGKNEAGVFRYYEYTDLSDQEVFDEYIRHVKTAAIYDTGLSAEYGDELLTLSTCNYHTQDGRFVVVARRIDNTG